MISLINYTGRSLFTALFVIINNFVITSIINNFLKKSPPSFLATPLSLEAHAPLQKGGCTLCRTCDENDENVIKSLNYDINELNDKLNESQSTFKKTFSLIHLNISSLQYHLDELSDLIDKSEAEFSIIDTTESHINKEIALLNNINLQNYNLQHIPTESNKSNKGGSLL